MNQKTFSYNQVTKVHLEMTDKCNASCPMCPRTINGGPLNPNLRNIELSLDQAKKVFTSSFLQQLKFIQLCGNFGDPIMAQDTLEILKYFREVNPKINLGIHTNGSARPSIWWKELGQILTLKGDYCKFALDGLEDTNHLYRRNTNWIRIMSSVESFIKAGGIAHWEFLVFKHNEHQVEQAEALSIKMGFKEFFLKKTARFYNYKTGLNEPYPIFDMSGKTIGHLEPPTEEKNVNPMTQTASDETAKEAVPQKEAPHIDCMSIADRSLFITAAGEILPCCFIGGELQYSHNSEESKYLSSLAHKTNTDLSSLQPGEKNLSQIVDGDWFKQISSSWDQADSKIHTCKLLCKKNFKIVASEYE